MSRKKFASRIYVSLVLTLLLVSSFSVLSSAETGSGLNGVDVEVSTEDVVKIAVKDDGKERYSVEYREIELQTSEMDYSVELAGERWNVSIEKVESEKFPHYQVEMDKVIKSDGITLGHLHFHFNVIAMEDMTEITFSYTLKDMPDLDGEIIISQEIGTQGQIIETPLSSTEEDISYYELQFPDGETGFYTVSRRATFDGEDAEARTFMYGRNDQKLLLMVDQEADSEQVSLEPVDVENSRTSAQVPVPEGYDHFSSLLLGLTISIGAVGGFMYKKRKEFYEEEKDFTVNLEDSPYYKE